MTERNIRKISDIVLFIGDDEKNWEEIHQHTKQHTSRNQLNNLMRNELFEVIAHTTKRNFSGGKWRIPIYKVKRVR